MREYVRVWKELDFDDIGKHLIILGELSCDCYTCHQIGLEKSTVQCPDCGTQFKYMAFRRRSITSGYLKKLAQDLPYLTFIELEDFKASTGKSDARKMLDL